MTNLFRNSSPNALTLKQSIELEKKRRAERHRQMRQARELAAQGRGEDTEIAHVARGEYVIPEALQTPELLTALRRAAAAKGIPMEMLSIGNAINSINPATGAPEFGIGDIEEITPDVMGYANRVVSMPINVREPVKPFGLVDSFMRGFTAIPRGVGEAIVNGGALISDGGKQAKQRVDANSQRMQEDYEAGRAEAGRSGFDIANAAGEYVGGYPIGRMFPKAATYGGATAIGAAKGAISSSLQPVDDPSASYWQQKLGQIKKGAVQGATEERAKYVGRRAKDWLGF
jgi:hypothetical protein